MPSILRRRRTPRIASLGLFATLGSFVTLGPAACGDPPASTGPTATPFEPPRVYRTLWADVEACSGRVGDPDRVRWQRTDSFPGQPLRLAQWEPGHVITLRSDMDVALPIVAHEILHDLLGGDGEHLDPAWLECALPVAGAGSD